MTLLVNEKFSVSQGLLPQAVPEWLVSTMRPLNDAFVASSNKPLMLTPNDDLADSSEAAVPVNLITQELVIPPPEFSFASGNPQTMPTE